MENALKAKPEDIRQIKDLQEGYGEAMFELRARKNCRKVKLGGYRSFETN
jgi:hypothetical protein